MNHPSTTDSSVQRIETTFQKETKETILLLNQALRVLASTEDKLHVLDMVIEAESVEEWKDFSEQFFEQWQRFVNALPQLSPKA
jgi:ABC-type antimicrobial peptide transport system ATPase subunit